MSVAYTQIKDGRYRIPRAVSGEELIGIAKNIIAESFPQGSKLESPQQTREFLMLELATEDRETFGVIFLNRQHQVIAFERMFQGTIDTAPVYPREVLKRCLELKATAVILAHNHPSGSVEPSEADKSITKRLSEALRLIDISVLDHLIIGGTKALSFAERGLL